MTMAVTVIVWVVPFGSTTVAVTLLAVLGPLLVIVTVAVMVWPGVPLAGALIVMAKSAPITPSEAVAAAAFVPTEVTKASAAMVFVTVPTTELVTTAVNVQVEPGGITVPIGKVKDPARATADTAPALQPTVVVTDGFALTNPAG